MGPDSGSFAVFCWLVAIIGLVCAVAIGPRIAQPSPRMWLARMGAHLGSTALFVLAMLVTLNAQYSWYVDWADVANGIFGGSAPVDLATGGGGASSVSRNASADQRLNLQAQQRYGGQRTTFEQGLRLVADPGPGGQFVHVHVPGLGAAAGPTAGDVLVWLPRSYTDPANRNRTYPVIEAFHGVPGGERDYERTWYRADKTFAPLMNTGRVGDAILVAPDLSPGHLDTECVDGAGIDMETWTTKLVPDFIIKHFRAKPEASAWASFGYSAGAWCSALAAVDHPDRYGAGIVLGGYFSPLFTNWWPYAPGRTPARYDLLDRLTRTRPATSIWIEVSQKDKLSGPPSAKFVKAARAPTSVTSVTLPHAGHRMEVWGGLIPQSLDWLARTLPAFSRTA